MTQAAEKSIDDALFALAVRTAALTLGSVSYGAYPDGVPYKDALRVAVIDAYGAIVDAREELEEGPG